MTALIEYLIRIRVEEPSAVPAAGESGEAMAWLFGEIEEIAVDQEIVSRTVLTGPDQPSRVRCAARSIDPSRHYATSTRWQIKTPNDATLTMCSAACALSWLCHEALLADAQNSGGTVAGGSESEVAA